MIELIAALILAIHLLSMNLASAGPLCYLWLKGGGESETISRLRMMRWSVVALLLGMVTGVLLWMIIPGEGLSQALARFPVRAYCFAAAELVFSLVCLLPLALDWNFLRHRSWLGKLLALLSATNLLYHFPPLMAIIGQLAANPQWTAEAVLDRPTLLSLMTQGHVLALSFHFGLSSLAVAAIATLSMITAETADLSPQQSKTIRKAGLVALLSTLLQIPVGIWLLASTSVATRGALMGDSLAATLVFVAALSGTLLLLQRLVSIVLGDYERKTLRGAGWLVLVVILLMTCALRWSRPAVPKALNTISPVNIHGADRLSVFGSFEAEC
ncbi:hypothetical protein [Bythopirellula polymerisocia]|uniref:hypothetical protein n=1 Tax=Bythopirellula polymerisocia TaxID=2528003 RepID=UPI0011B65331|nr:hypothetical protein [Bythopirellula polymerisocia]